MKNSYFQINYFYYVYNVYIIKKYTIFFVLFIDIELVKKTFWSTNTEIDIINNNNQEEKEVPVSVSKRKPLTNLNCRTFDLPLVQVKESSLNNRLRKEVGS